MELLKHGNFVFSNILRGGYNILENEPNIINETIMANGSKRRNYGLMPKTNIKIKFGELTKELFQEYMSHFSQNEDIYSYFSPRSQTMLTKKFAISFPESTLLYANDTEQKYDEFEVELKQIDEVEQ